MVTILCEQNIDELMQTPPEYMPSGETKLFRYTETKPILTGEEILYNTVMSLQVSDEGKPYLTISDDSTYCDYHPEDYDMNLYELHNILTHNLLTEGYWGV